MGLLTKIRTTAPIKPCFSTFCKKYGFIHAGVFGIVDGMYILIKAAGIDAQSVIHSVSSPDFWNGSVSKSDVWISYAASDNSLSSFYQLFSKNVKDMLARVHFLHFTFNGKTFFFFTADYEVTGQSAPLPSITPLFLYELAQNASYEYSYDDDTEETARRITQGVAHFAGTKLVLSFDSLLAKCADSSLITIHLKEAVVRTLFDEIIASLGETVGDTNILYVASNYELRMIFFSSLELNESLVHMQFSQTLEPIFEDLLHDLVFVHVESAVRDISEIERFLYSE